MALEHLLLVRSGFLIVSSALLPPPSSPRDILPMTPVELPHEQDDLDLSIIKDQCKDFYKILTEIIRTVDVEGITKTCLDHLSRPAAIDHSTVDQSIIPQANLTS